MIQSRCEDCGWFMNDAPRSHCRNSEHSEAYEHSFSQEYLSRLSTRIRSADNFEELRDLLATYFAEKGE